MNDGNSEQQISNSGKTFSTRSIRQY